jgi:hypothetical protein
MFRDDCLSLSLSKTDLSQSSGHSWLSRHLRAFPVIRAPHFRRAWGRRLVLHLLYRRKNWEILQQLVYPVVAHGIANIALAYSLSAYPDLDKHIRDNGTSGIVCLSLGEDGSYFFRNDGGSAWKLPQSVTDHAGLRSKDDDPVEFLFLGKDDAYYAETRGGSTRWNFKGNYGSLNATIRHSTSGVRCLGMNLQDDRSYFLLFKDGDTQCNPGTSGLTQQSFSTWAARFRTLL